MVTKPKKELKEKNFIHEGNSKVLILSWIFFFLAVILFSLFASIGNWFKAQTREEITKSPFLQVTNRQFSLFLWQNPQYMRNFAKNKTGYLPGFQPSPKVTPDPEQADNYVIAPPDVLFHYHTWQRLLAEYQIPRPIPPHEFAEFLEADKEWLPAYWKDATKEYKSLVKGLESQKGKDLNHYEKKDLPFVVRQAFWGWKNFFKEGDEINKVQPSKEEIEEFLSTYPHYRRNYWKNIYPHYLLDLQDKNIDSQAKLSNENFTPFFKTAFFNFQKAKLYRIN
jgi:hypothetical protein